MKICKIRRSIGSVSVAISLGVAGGACSSSNSVSSSQAATDLGTALCTKIGSCSMFYVDVAWNDMASCGTRTAASAMNTLAANGTGWTPSAVDSCAHAIAATSCDENLGNNPPPTCHSPAGQLTDGTACGDSSQCRSTYCNTGTGICGTCAAARGAVASPCYRDDDCNYGLVCEGATTATTTQGTCTQLAASGADCNSQHPCERTLACKGNKCTTPDGAGATCSAGTCDTLAGLFCQVPAGQATGTCAKVSLSPPGSPCGLINGSFTECSGGGTCVLASTTTGTCQAPIPDGMPCDAANGPGCLSPATCTNGKCGVPDPSSCH